MLSEIRGKGLMIGIQFSEPKSLKLRGGWKLVHKLNKSLFGQMITVPLMEKHHILTQVAGHNLDVIKLLPPLIINESHAKRFLNAFEEELIACHKFPGGSWNIVKNLAVSAAKQSNMLKHEKRT